MSLFFSLLLFVPTLCVCQIFVNTSWSELPDDDSPLGNVFWTGIHYYNGFIYSFCGQIGSTETSSQTNWIEIDDFLTDSSPNYNSYLWTDDGSVSLSDGFRVVSSSTIVNNKVYFISPYPQYGYMLIFDLISNTQISMNSYLSNLTSFFDIPTTFFDPCVVNNGTHIFVLGGESIVDASIGSYAVHDFVFIYDIDNDLWYQGPDMQPNGRAIFQCNYDNTSNVIWVYGGYSSLPNAFLWSTHSTFQYFDLNTMSWDGQLSLDTGRAAMGIIPLFNNMNNNLPPWLNTPSLTIILPAIVQASVTGFTYEFTSLPLNLSINNPTTIDNEENIFNFEYNSPRLVEFNAEILYNSEPISIYNATIPDYSNGIIELYEIYEYGAVAVGGTEEITGSTINIVNTQYYINITIGKLIDTFPIPTQVPTIEPSVQPSNIPTVIPTIEPTKSPTITDAPTDRPTINPTKGPTNFQIVIRGQPTANPIMPTISPTLNPTNDTKGKQEEDSGDGGFIEFGGSSWDLASYICFSLAFILPWLIIICGCISKSSKPGADRPKYSAMLKLFFTMGDFYSDVIFATVLAITNHPLWIYGLFFTAVPHIISNVLCMFRLVTWRNKNVYMTKYIDRYDWFIIAMSVLAGFYSAIEVAQSKFFYWNIFSLQMRVREYSKSKTWRFWNTVMLENFPQLCIQILYAVDTGLDFLVFSTMLFSGLSLLIGMEQQVSRWSRKYKSDAKDHYFLRIKIKSGEMKSYHIHTHFLLGLSLSNAMDVDNDAIEVYYIHTAHHGIVALAEVFDYGESWTPVAKLAIEQDEHMLAVFKTEIAKYFAFKGKNTTDEIKVKVEFHESAEKNEMARMKSPTVVTMHPSLRNINSSSQLFSTSNSALPSPVPKLTSNDSDMSSVGPSSPPSERRDIIPPSKQASRMSALPENTNASGNSGSGNNGNRTGRRGSGASTVSRMSAVSGMSGQSGMSGASGMSGNSRISGMSSAPSMPPAMAPGMGISPVNMHLNKQMNKPNIAPYAAAQARATNGNDGYGEGGVGLNAMSVISHMKTIQMQQMNGRNINGINNNNNNSSMSNVMNGMNGINGMGPMPPMGVNRIPSVSQMNGMNPMGAMVPMNPMNPMNPMGQIGPMGNPLNRQMSGGSMNGSMNMPMGMINNNSNGMNGIQRIPSQIQQQMQHQQQLSGNAQNGVAGNGPRNGPGNAPGNGPSAVSGVFNDDTSSDSSQEQYININQIMTDNQVNNK